MNKKVLIIEDDVFLRGLEEKKLLHEGFVVTAVESAEKAVEWIEKETPDIILLDLLLPGMDGYSFLQKVRENLNLREKPVIVFSNIADVGGIKKAKDLGANDFMIKSNFTLEELVERMKGLLK